MNHGLRGHSLNKRFFEETQIINSILSSQGSRDQTAKTHSVSYVQMLYYRWRSSAEGRKKNNTHTHLIHNSFSPNAVHLEDFA